MSSISATGFINAGLTVIGEASTYLLDKSGHLIAPMILGNIGGRMMGVSAQVGLIQGLSSGVYHAVVHVPFQRYVAKNTGPAKDQISEKAANFFKFMGVICGVVMPIIFTARYGQAMADKMVSYLPEKGLIRWCLVSDKRKEYSVFNAVMVNVMPTIAQHVISFWRKEDQRNRRL